MAPASIGMLGNCSHQQPLPGLHWSVAPHWAQAMSMGLLCDAEAEMRDPEVIEEELFEISAIADDSTKLERLVSWCAVHPDEVPFALHMFMSGKRWQKD